MAKLTHDNGCGLRPDCSYERRRDLPKLIYVADEDLAAAETSVAGHLQLLAKIEKALRRERRNGVSGAWPYDPGRHRGLATALRAEARVLRVRMGCRMRPASCRETKSDRRTEPEV